MPCIAPHINGGLSAVGARRQCAPRMASNSCTVLSGIPTYSNIAITVPGQEDGGDTLSTALEPDVSALPVEVIGRCHVSISR